MRLETRELGYRWILGLCAVLAAAPLSGQLIQTVDYSDTFTVAQQGGNPARTDGIFGVGSPAYDVEDSHGNPLATWTPDNFFSFNTGLGSACCGYNTNDGNPGSASGLAQSGGGDYSFAYGLRTSYVVQLDSILPLDRLDISSLPGPGAGIFSSPSLSVFLRRDSVAGTPHPAFPLTGLPGIGLYNGSMETAVTDDAGSIIYTGIQDDNWHNFAVHFDQDTGSLTVYVDENPIASLDLNTFAGGAYKTYSNTAVGTGGAGYDFVTKVLWVDNFRVGAPPTKISACFSLSQNQGPAPLTVDVSAACSLFEGTPKAYRWDFGDGTQTEGIDAQHTYLAGGFYTITLTVEDILGNTATASKPVAVFSRVLSFEDSFERADGPPGGWTVFSGDWRISGGGLTIGPTSAEQWIWAGSPPVMMTRNATYAFDYSFLAAGTVAGINRHGGMLFCASVPTQRGDAAFRGYFVDWIDRVDDRGVRLTRVDNGAFVTLVGGAPNSPADPPLHWVVAVEDEHIRVIGDGTLYIDVVDENYRGGLFGFWTWTGGQEVRVDNVAVTGQPLTACFGASPIVPEAGTLITFDAGCSEAFQGGIATYEWDFGNGDLVEGPSVTHTYPDAGDYTVQLTVKNDAGNTDSVTRTVTVRPTLRGFVDCFDRDPGAVSGWTPDSGDWTIAAGATETITAGAESWVWAGTPPGVLSGNFEAEFDFSFLAQPADGVGRHAGAAFLASVPSHRYAGDFRGYFVDWIDRAQDHGFRLTRVDNGVLHELVLGAPDSPDDPPLHWKVQVEGEKIRLFGDEVLYVDWIDSTYREGYFGFWAYANGQDVQVDNVLIPGFSNPACRISITATVTGAENPILHVKGALSSPGCVPIACDCNRIELYLDDNFVQTIPPPPGLEAEVPLALLGPCAPGSTHTLGVRCLSARGEPGPMGTSNFTCPGTAGGLQLAGDCNQDGRRDISDAVCIFGYLFLGNPALLPCGDHTAADASNVKLIDHNGDLLIDISDGVALITYLFLSGPPPAAGEPCLSIAGCAEKCAL